MRSGYSPVVSQGGRSAHLYHPELGFACPYAEKRNPPWRPAPDMPLCRRCQRLIKRPALASSAGKNPPPWNIAMREVLQDGEWHEIAELARRCGHTIPPNKAMSWFLGHVAPKRSPGWSARMTSREKIRLGRFYLCMRAITDWLAWGTVEADRPPRCKGRRVRLVERRDPSPRNRDERGRFAGG